ncbi:hypothetical protein GJV80_16060 [Microlunatus sp. Gsoil 973]|nr:hypothetical protein GJV80_16060 [Microlunatus sp. Gsoil 973]
MPNDLLHDPVRHNNWASIRLLEFVRDQQLTAGQLAATGVGTFGNIPQTIDHVLRSDAGYLGRLIGTAQDWVGRPEELELGTLHDHARRRPGCGSNSWPSRSTRSEWSSSTTGPRASAPVSCLPRQSITRITIVNRCARS